MVSFHELSLKPMGMLPTSNRVGLWHHCVTLGLHLKLLDTSSFLTPWLLMLCFVLLLWDDDLVPHISHFCRWEKIPTPLPKRDQNWWNASDLSLSPLFCYFSPSKGAYSLDKNLIVIGGFSMLKIMAHPKRLLSLFPDLKGISSLSSSSLNTWMYSRCSLVSLIPTYGSQDLDLREVVRGGPHIDDRSKLHPPTQICKWQKHNKFKPRFGSYSIY